jgi:hypothetical protein
MDKVYTKICSMESQRELSLQNTSADEQLRVAKQASGESSKPQPEVIVAEIDLTKVKTTTGANDKDRKSRGSKQEEEGSEGSSCAIF